MTCHFTQHHSHVIHHKECNAKRWYISWYDLAEKSFSFEACKHCINIISNLELSSTIFNITPQGFMNPVIGNIFGVLRLLRHSKSLPHVLLVHAALGCLQ